MMPTFRENIAYFLRKYVYPQRAKIAHIAKALVLLCALSLALEVFIFNFNYFASSGLDTINLEKRITLKKNTNETFNFTEVNREIEFNNLNTEVDNVGIFFVTNQPAQNLPIKILFTDEAHLRYFDSTEYTEGVPIVNIATNARESQIVSLNTTGVVNSLKISIVGDEVQFPITLKTVELNAHYPFRFNTLRMLAVYGVLLVIFAFRPRSAIYKLSIVKNPRKSKAAIIATVAIECVLVTSFLFYGSNLVGVATSSYNYGEWDQSSLINTYETGGENAQQYAELARAMAHGQLYLEEEPPDWLKEMDTPYDKGARDEAQKDTGEPYLFDVAYYDGKYYVYFGVVPALLFYLPFYLITGENFPTAIGVLIAILAFILGVSALLDRFARYHFKKVSLGIYLLMQIALITGCGILYLIKFPTFYSLPLACGLAFSVWGLYFWMRGRASKKATTKSRCINFFIGSLFMALVVGCRPQLLLLSLLAFPLFWRPYIKERRLFKKRGLLEFLCLIAPYVLIAVGIMLYNHARFGSFTDFGANYNLTVNDMTQRGWIFGRFAPAFFAYFIQLPNVSGVFPFLQPVDFATTYMGQTIKEVTFGGIFACYPVLWILFFAAPILRMRNNQRETKTISGVIFVLVVSGIIIGLVDAQMAGILQRYYADFSFMFFAAIVLLVFIVNENLVELKETSQVQEPRRLLGNGMRSSLKHPLHAIAQGVKIKRRKHNLYKDQILYQPGRLARDLFTKTLIVLVTIGVIYSSLLCFVPETGWYSNIYPWAYQNLLDSVIFWK